MAINKSNTANVNQRPVHTLWGDAWFRLRKNKLAMAGGIFIILLSLAAIFAPFITHYGFAQQDLTAILQGPSAKHWLGTDGLGRDTFARLLYGARTSLAVGIFTQVIVVGIGLPIGAVAGYAGGSLDNILMRFVDVMYSFPSILLIILMKAILGGGIYQLFFAIGLVSWVDIARLVRGQIMSIKSRDYVAAARAMGGMGPYITERHLLPNSLGPIIVTVTFSVPQAIFAEATLSFMGIGVRPPTPSWGTMINDGYAVLFSSWYQVLFPALAIALLMISFTFLGDGLRDALDPKMRH